MKINLRIIHFQTVWGELGFMLLPVFIRKQIKTQQLKQCNFLYLAVVVFISSYTNTVCFVFHDVVCR